MSFLFSSFVLVLSAAPLADVFPYEVKNLPDGSRAYEYDLTAVKAAGGTAEAKALHGEEKVKAFLDSLPRSARLLIDKGEEFDIGPGRAFETALTHSFASVSDGPLTLGAAAKQRVKLRMPLDPAEPHLLLSADAVAWQIRQLELAALAAEEHDTEILRRELWTRVLERALPRFRTTEGDAREGALALVARVSAGLACLDAAKIPEVLRGQPEATAATFDEIVKLLQSADALLVPAPWQGKSELECAWVRMRTMGQPFEPTRAGTAAVLSFIDILKEPKVAALWQRVLTRRDRFLGSPRSDPLLLWREHAGDKPNETIDSLNDFIASLPFDGRQPPALVALAQSPMGAFFSELAGAERSFAFLELANAIQDGRVAPLATTWPSAREAALASLCLPEVYKRVHLDSGWRQRLQQTFVTLVGGFGTAPEAGGDEPEADAEERTRLEIKLMVPPNLEVEPVPDFYRREAQALERLIEALQAEKLTQLEALGSEGSVLSAAKTWVKRLKGLVALTNADASSAKEAAEARRWVSNWRAEESFSRDVREASAFPLASSGQRQHAAIVGVSRREMTVRFSGSPKVQFAGGRPISGFSVAPSAQRYIVPVLLSVGANAEATRRPLDRQTLRAVVDQGNNEAAQVERAFTQVMGSETAIHQ